MRCTFTIVIAVLALAAAAAAAAQDEGIDPLLFVGPSANTTTTGSLTGARIVELYRVPLDYTVRSADDHRWGFSLTCPVTISGVRINRVQEAERLVHSLGVFAVVPGIAFDIPVARGLRIRPFAEVGVGKGTDRRKTEVLYGVGVGARLDRRAGDVLLTFGGEVNHRRSVTDTGVYEAHSTLEAGVDAQIPLGFSLWSRDVRGGGYVIARNFVGFTLTRPGYEPVDLDHQYEVGLSLSTAPALKIWKVDFPWLAVGYQFGPVLTGIRLYTSFPF